MRVGILGATGSIGTQTLDVIRKNRDKFTVSMLSANANTELLERQTREFSPLYAVSPNAKTGKIGKTEIINDITVLNEPHFYDNCDIIINGIGGIYGLLPTLAVLKSGARLATANKESLVAAGEIIKNTAKQYNKEVIPVDSEHSAVYQCLEKGGEAEKIILTASGGAFRDYTKDELKSAKAEDALKHPVWKMGKRVTVDSATLVNKGMEIIEALWLFGTQNIDVLVHREGIVHGMVCFKDGSVKANLSVPDMRLPIQYALSCPERFKCLEPPDFAGIGRLTFEKPDTDRFPALGIAYEIKENPRLGVVFQAADEIAAEAYLLGKTSFYGVTDMIKKALDRFSDAKPRTAEEVLDIDKKVKEYLTC